MRWASTGYLLDTLSLPQGSSGTCLIACKIEENDVFNEMYVFVTAWTRFSGIDSDLPRDVQMLAVLGGHQDCKSPLASRGTDSQDFSYRHGVRVEWCISKLETQMDPPMRLSPPLIRQSQRLPSDSSPAMCSQLQSSVSLCAPHTHCYMQPLLEQLYQRKFQLGPRARRCQYLAMRLARLSPRSMPPAPGMAVLVDGNELLYHAAGLG